MKVLHINTSQAGGAAWCAIRINKALSLIGVDSRMLFAEGESMPEGVKGAIAVRDQESWYSNSLTTKIKHVLNRMPWYWDKEKMDMQINDAISKIEGERPYVHHPYSYYRNIANHPLVEWADIIHLHWVPDFVDYPTFFRQVKRPIVWTLHDKYPAEGVMHYSSKYFPVPEELKDIDKRSRQAKRKGVKKSQNLNIVAISDEMIDLCKKSEVLYDFPITLIHNGVDTNVFKPYDKHIARKSLGLPSTAKIFLFSSYGINDRNKGLDRLICALEKSDISNILLVCIGEDLGCELPKARFSIIITGLQKEQEKIAKYYSASDFFMQCSYEETFAQTPLEAMSCGTPVISTPCSGAKDLIRPFNGVICSGYDSNAIAEGIQKAINTQYNCNTIRQYIVENYEYSIIAQQYKELYESILES